MTIVNMQPIAGRRRNCELGIAMCQSGSAKVELRIAMCESGSAKVELRIAMCEFTGWEFGSSICDLRFA